MKKIIILALVSGFSAFAFNTSQSVTCKTAGEIVDAGFEFKLSEHNFLNNELSVSLFRNGFAGKQTVRDNSRMNLKVRGSFFGLSKRLVIENESKTFKAMIKPDMTGKLLKVSGQRVAKEFKNLICE